MKSPSRFLHCLRRANLPAALLITFLQRAPVVRIAMAGAEAAFSSSAGNVLRAALAAATAMGALDTLAGATTIVASMPSPLNATVGVAPPMVAFGINGNGLFASAWAVVGGSSIPPGMIFSAGAAGPNLTGPGTFNSINPILVGTPTAPGVYQIHLEAWESPNQEGAESPEFVYTVNVAGAQPTFTIQPNPLIIDGTAGGTTVVFTVSATNATSYQWKLNGQNVSQGNASGGNTATLLISGVSNANLGSYACVASNAAGSATSNTATLAVTTTANPGRLINLSILSDIQGSLGMGFVIGGSGTNGSESLLIRGVGPSIGPGSAFNVPGVITDPTLTVVQQTSHATVASNSGWGANQAAVTAADNATGAFPLTNPASLDSAVVANLPGIGGGYSATVAGKSGDNGYALTEVYDDTANYIRSSPRLINLSCLTQIVAGGTLDVGFVVGGTTAKTVLVRVGGPALNALYGIAGAMSDPQLQVSPLSNSSTVLAFNAGWGGSPQIVSVANSVGAYAFPNPSSLDSAALVTLSPGAYTVQVASTSGGGGTALVELYEVP